MDKYEHYISDSQFIVTLKKNYVTIIAIKNLFTITNQKSSKSLREINTTNIENSYQRNNEISSRKNQTIILPFQFHGDSGRCVSDFRSH